MAVPSPSTAATEVVGLDQTLDLRILVFPNHFENYFELAQTELL